ncbi:MAG: hypothetical protein ACMG57_00745 [Candidatus Dojkabacteria bacterium]
MSDFIPGPEGFKGKVSLLTKDDMFILPPFLFTNFIDNESGYPAPGLVQRLLNDISDSLKDINDNKFLIAKVGSVIVGFIGLRVPSEELKYYAVTINPCELIIPLASGKFKTMPICLLMNFMKLAKEEGYTEVLLNMDEFDNSTAFKMMDIETGEDEFFSDTDGDILVWRWVSS